VVAVSFAAERSGSVDWLVRDHAHPRQVSTLARKGRARRFREARELKQGFDDGLFQEGSGTLADVDLDADDAVDDDLDDEDEVDEDWDDDPLREDDRRIS
jgi:hypothetical protein